MTRCLSPVPPNPPAEIRTDITCASFDLTGEIVIPPTNCVCPDTILDYPVGNFEFYYDRYWNVGNPGVRIQRQYIVALLVNQNGRFYDQVFIHSDGECYPGRRKRIEVQVLNRPGLQKVALIDYDYDGLVDTVHFDVDMSAVFGDGQPHWVTIVSYDGGGDFTGTRIYVDDVEIGDRSRIFNDLSDFVKLRVSGNVATDSLPFPMWQYQQSIEDCISSGQYNGLGGCQIMNQTDALKWDRQLTDLNISLFNDDRVAVPFEGAATGRVAYLNHPTMSGRVYWEVDRGDAGNCRVDGSFAFGCAERQLVLGTEVPGMVEGSWGLSDEANRLFADGVQLAVDLQFSIRTMFCYDVQDRRLWIGYENSSQTPGVRFWNGGGEPGAGADSWQLFPIVRDLRIVFRFFESLGSVYVSSSARSCQFPAPASFGYLT